MNRPIFLKVLFQSIVLIAVVIVFSTISMRLWGGSAEKIAINPEIIVKTDMTVTEFGQINALPNEVLTDVFGVTTPLDFEKRLSEFEMDEGQIVEQVNKSFAFYVEESSKNWLKIALKFPSWIIFLSIVFVLTRKAAITPSLRNLLYALSIIIFGIVLGADPSPMGTVKDAIVLFGSKGIIFPPRMIALTVFLLMVFVANKFICSWGCQFGTLQDLIFRFNSRTRKNSWFRQYKPPFIVTNTIRIIVFVTLTLMAFVWAFDIVGQVDPFKIYNPSMVSSLGWIFIGLILGLSLFIYRPWCHLFCPFGLTGWLVEKISLFKIKVNYETCTACEACAKACPSNAMDAILRRENVIPDCFSCSSCINVCTTNSISFSAGKRDLPPIGKYFDRE